MDGREPATTAIHDEQSPTIARGRLALRDAVGSGRFSAASTSARGCTRRRDASLVCAAKWPRAAGHANEALRTDHHGRADWDCRMQIVSQNPTLCGSCALHTSSEGGSRLCRPELVNRRAPRLSP